LGMPENRHWTTSSPKPYPSPLLLITPDGVDCKNALNKFKKKTSCCSACCSIVPLETLPPLPPGDPNGGVVYLRVLRTLMKINKLVDLLVCLFVFILACVML